VRVDRFVRYVCVLSAVFCVGFAGLVLLPGIHEQRKDLELVVGEETFDDMPPGIALPTALFSTFRGVMIHFLWTRAEELKQDSKYFELQQLYDWICNLQPRYPKVWGNAAWNMSYNISVGTYSSRERWHWVSSGAWLLRDKGIPLNPQSIDLYRELSYIYQHKMGDFMDDHHWSYKRNWAVIVERVLGQPPADPEPEPAIEAIREIAEAAGAIREFGTLSKPESLQLYIEHDDNAPSMNDFAGRLATLGFHPDAGWLDAVARHRRGAEVRALAVDEANTADEGVDQFGALMADEKLAPARDRLLAAVRAHVLNADLRLDPQYLLDLMEQFGPLDWRSVYSNSLYWAALGSRECGGTVGLDENAEMNTHRFIQFGVKDSLERGRIVLNPDFDDPFQSYIQMLPDSRFGDVLHEAFLDLGARDRPRNEDPAKYFKEGPAGRLYKSGHVNFLHTLVRQLFIEGRIQKAEHYYAYLRDNYKEPDGRTKEMYLTSLEEFALKDYWEDIVSFRQGPRLIANMMQVGLLNLIYNRPKEGARRIRFAREGHEKYQESYKMDRTERRRIPPWPEVKAGVFRDFLITFPLPKKYDMVYKARAWAAMDVETKLAVYRDVVEHLNTKCSENDPPLDPAKAFPPPPGWEEIEAGREEEKERAPEEAPDIRDVEVEEGSGG
jgi:hypothetical protein